MLAMQSGSEEVSPIYPYIESEEELLGRKATLDKRKVELDPAAIEEKLRKARDTHFANKAKRG